MTTNKTFDVAVVGAGVFGGWTAYRLRRAGAEVVLVDAYGPANSRASSGGESRVIRMGYGPDRIYTRMAQRSLALWQKFFSRQEAGGGQREGPLFRQTGVLWLARESDPYCEAMVETLDECGVEYERLDRAELARRYPQIEPNTEHTEVLTEAQRRVLLRDSMKDSVSSVLANNRPSENDVRWRTNKHAITWGILEPNSGVLMARQAVQAVVAQARALGVAYQEEAVLPFDDDNDADSSRGKLESLRTISGGEILAGQLVFACGPWLPKIFPALLGELIHVTRQEVFFFGVPAGDSRFGPERMPAWIDINDLVYGIPNLDNRGFKVALDVHGPQFDPDNGDRIVAPEGVAAVRAYLAGRMPALQNAPVTESRVCQYENTSNGDFLIDRHPAFENVWLVGGGSGHGFKHGPAVGEHVARLISGDAEVEPRFSLATKERVHSRKVF